MNTTQQNTTVATDAIVTEHDTAQGEMTQHWGNPHAVRIVTNRTTAVTGVYVHNTLRSVDTGLTMAEYAAVQAAAYLVWTQTQQVAQ